MSNDATDRNAPDCSIILPRCEANDALADVVTHLQAAAAKAGLAAELLCLDTRTVAGSPAHALQAIGPQLAVRLLRFDAPVGLGVAWAAGIAAARADMVVAWEASRCYAADDLPRLVARLSRADLIVGRRRRNWLARQARRAALVPRRMLVGRDVLDPHSPIWAARREAVLGLPLELGLENWIAALVARRGYRVCELNIGYDAAHAMPSTAHTVAPHMSELIAAWHICRQPPAAIALESSAAEATHIAQRAVDESPANVVTGDRASSVPGPWLLGDTSSHAEREERAA